MFDISIKTFLPVEGEDHIEQLESCISQIIIFLEKEGLSKKHILKQSIFVNVENNSSFKYLKNKLIENVNKFFMPDIPTTGFIGQIPIDNKKIVVEFMVLNEKINKIDFKKYGEFNYSIININEIKTLFCSGITSKNLELGAIEQAEYVFTYMEKILQTENMDFSNIIRQWNYIESITGFDKQNYELQNYQAFNDIRSEFYKKNNFINGYPSATGIGMNAGGLMVEFIASEFSDEINVKSISSPLQHDAYKYSKEVLVGGSGTDCRLLSTPKFERAKVVQFKKRGIVFISGTAAIDGQSTVIDTDIEQQALYTIDNIKKLISNKNLLLYGVIPEESFFTNIRVYIKKKEDVSKVRKVFNKEFHNIDVLYLISDICREKLLIEIEGVLSL